MKYSELPEDLQEKVKQLTSKYTLTLDEVAELYLMGGSHTDCLCQLKAMNMPDVFISLENIRLWNEENKNNWNKLRS